MEKFNRKEKELFERDVGSEDYLDNQNDPEKVKEDLMKELDGCLNSLDEAIEKYHTTGKVPIGGYYFDARYAKNLSVLMHKIRSGNETNYQKAADFINLQLITASKCWRSVCAKLESIA